MQNELPVSLAEIDTAESLDCQFFGFRNRRLFSFVVCASLDHLICDRRAVRCVGGPTQLRHSGVVRHRSSESFNAFFLFLLLTYVFVEGAG